MEKGSFNANQRVLFPPWQNGINHLDGISQSALARLMPKHRSIYDSILSNFGKDISGNIFFMAAFADGSPEPSVVSAVKAAEIPFTSFFSENEDCDEDMNLDEMFWKLCSEISSNSSPNLPLQSPKVCS